MRIAKLIELVERAGGRFTLVNRQAELGWPEQLSPKKQCKVRRLDRQVRKAVYLVTAELLEREYSRQWERDFACHCPALRSAHSAHRPPNIWKAMLE